MQQLRNHILWFAYSRTSKRPRKENAVSEERRQEDTEDHHRGAQDQTLNEFLSDVSFAARELTANIRSSVNKVLEQSVRIVNPSGDGPPLDMYETEENVIIETAPLENADPDSIEITFQGDQLRIQIQTQDARQIEENAFLLREKSFGEFSRSVDVPRAVQVEAARAKIEDGKLIITLPKPRGAAARRIHITAED